MIKTRSSTSSSFHGHPESWCNDKGEYETRTEWHRVYALQGLSKFARTLQKGQLAEIHATSMQRLSKIEDADDPHDGAGEEWLPSISG